MGRRVRTRHVKMELGPDELATILSHCVVADARRLRSVSWQWHAAASDDLKRRPSQALPSCRMHEPVYPAVGEDVVVEAVEDLAATTEMGTAGHEARVQSAAR